jgi:predicted N-formylglutamate amidohydrolase
MLDEDEPESFTLLDADGPSSAVIICDHASFKLPRAVGDLGLTAPDRMSHIGWDIGALGVAQTVARILQAPLVASGYSRLVIDCNRPLAAEASIPEVTCGVPVPGNRGLGQAEREARAAAFFWPYHRAIEAVMGVRQQRGHPTMLISVHSFTPNLHGKDRPWHVGVMYGRDRRLAGAMLDELGRPADIVVGDNEPYRCSDGTDYAIPIHGERAGRPAVLIEVRQDLIEHEAGQKAWGERLVKAYRAIEASLLSS